MNRLSNFRLGDPQLQEDFSADSSQIEEQLNNGELRDSLIQEGRYNQLPSYRKVHASFTSQKNSMYLMSQISNASDQLSQQFLQHQGQFFQQGNSSSQAITARTFTTQTLNCIKNKQSRIATEYEQDIQKDVDRTFHDTQYLNNQRNLNQLVEILTALSHSVAEVGYIQGWNMIAGVFIKNQFNSQLIYWSINFIMHKMQAKQLFLNNFKATRILDYQFEIICKNYIPDLYRFLVLRVWMLFLLKGWKYLLKIGIAILKIVKQQIMNSNDEDEVNQFLKKQICKHFQNNPIDEQKLFDIAKSIKVSNTLMDRLDQLYQNNYPHLKMNLRINRIRIGSNRQKTIIELEKQPSISSNFNSIENWNVDEETASEANKDLNNNQIFNRRATYELNYYIGGQKRQGSQNALPSQTSLTKTQQIGQQKVQQQGNATANFDAQNYEAGPYDASIQSSQVIYKRNSEVQPSLNNNSAIKALKITKIIGQSHLPYQRTNNSIILNQQANSTNNNFSQLHQTPCKSQQANQNINIINNNLTFNASSNKNHNNFIESNELSTNNKQTNVEMRTSILKDTEMQLPSLQTQTTMSSQYQLNLYQNSSASSSTVESNAKKNDFTSGSRYSNLLSQQQNSQREESQFGQLSAQQQVVFTIKQQTNNNNTYQLPSIPENTLNCCENNIFSSNNGLTQSYMPMNSSTNSEQSKQMQQLQQNPSHKQYYNSNNNNNGTSWQQQNSLVLQQQDSIISTSSKTQTQSNERITLSMLNQMNKSKGQSKEVSPTANLTRSDEQNIERGQIINLIQVKKNSEINEIASSSNIQSQTIIKNRSETSSQYELKQSYDEKSPIFTKGQQKQQEMFYQQNQLQKFQQVQKGQLANKQNVETNSFFQKIINIFKTKENQASSLSTKDSISKQDEQLFGQSQQPAHVSNAANHSFNKQQRNKSFDLIGVVTNQSIQNINHAITSGGAVNRKYSNNKGKHLQTEVSIRNNNDLSHESISDEAIEHQNEDINNTISNRFALARKYSVQNNGRTTPQNKINVNRVNRDNLDIHATVSSNSNINTIERAMSFKKESYSDNHFSKDKYGKLNNNYFNSKTQQDQDDSPIAADFNSANDNYTYKYNTSSSKKTEKTSESNANTQQIILHQIKQQQKNLLSSNKISQTKNNGSGSIGSYSNLNQPSNTQNNLNLQNPKQQNDFYQVNNQQIHKQPSICLYPNSGIIDTKRLPSTSQVSSKNGEMDYQQYSSEKSATKLNNLPISSTNLHSGGLSPPKQSKKEEDIASLDEGASLSVKLRAKPKNLTKLPLKNVNQISPGDYKLQIIQDSKNSASYAKNSIPQEFQSEQKSPTLQQQTHQSQFVQPFETYHSGKKTFTEVSEFNSYSASNNSIRVFSCKSNNNLITNEGFSPTKDNGSSNLITNNNFYYLGNPQYYQNNYRNYADKNEPPLSITSEYPYKCKKENHSLGPYQANAANSNIQGKNNYFISTSHQSASSSQLNNQSQKNMTNIPISSSSTAQFSLVPQRNFENNLNNNVIGNDYNNNQMNQNQNRFVSNPENYQSAINQESLAEKTNSFFASNSKYIYKKHSLTSANVDTLNKKIQ